jgi:DNA mismatch repair ATPase MutS
MCYVGVPENSIKHWVSKFSARGYKVAVVEQMETSNEAKNRSKSTKATYGSKETAVTRELTQIFTAGTLVDPDMITDSTMNNYILSVKVCYEVHD